MTNSGAIPVPFRRNQVIPVPFRWNPVIPADSGAIPADSGAIPADSGGFRRNYRIPDGICGAPKSTASSVARRIARMKACRSEMVGMIGTAK
jgi:hypothetical protein